MGLYVLGMLLLVSCGSRMFGTGPAELNHRDDDVYVPGYEDSVEDDDAHGLLGAGRGGFGSGATTVSVAQLRGSTRRSAKLRPASPNV